MYDLMKKRSEESKSRTYVGKISDNLYLNMTLELIGAIDGAKGIPAIATRAGSLQQMTTQMYQSLARNLSNAGQISAEAASAINAGATSRAVSVIDKVGKVASAVGILLSAFKAYDGYASDDGAKMLGNELLMLGGFVGLFMATGVGLGIVIVLLNIGTVIEILGARSDLEKWVAESFWGLEENIGRKQG